MDIEEDKSKDNNFNAVRMVLMSLFISELNSLPIIKS